ncbi:hypothetical protein KRX57_05660 [Weeksellaceae bacterium TAE3-ERU29]|nr:hypothetical protein [Weeksellaceae bacterium TAE3-ERU29]
MKRVFTTLAIVLAGVTFAQVGINTENNGDIAPDAVFHVKNKTGEKKGVVLPSVSLNSRTEALNGSANTAGLLVWNDGNGSVTPAGYYYWNGTSWAKVGNAIGAVYEKVRVFRGDTFAPTDFQKDDHVIAFTKVTQVTLPSAEENKTRTLCLRNSTTAPFGPGAEPLSVYNVVADAKTINPGFTRCYTSFIDTDNQWYWISSSL